MELVLAYRFLARHNPLESTLTFEGFGGLHHQGLKIKSPGFALLHTHQKGDIWKEEISLFLGNYN